MIPRRVLEPVARLGARLPVAVNRRWPVIRCAKRFLLGRLRREQVEIDGHIFRLDVTDSLRLGLDERHETEISAIMTRLLHPGDLVVDGGAHIGYHSLHMARLVGPRGRVEAFEPDPTNFGLLEHNISVNEYDNINARDTAVWSRSCRRHLYLRDDHHGDHRLYDPGDGRTRIEVRAIDLDSVLTSSPLSPRLIKLDLQGAELHALRGMQHTLHEAAGLALILEFWPRGLRACGSDPRELLTMLEASGFQVWEIDRRGRAPQRRSAEELLQRLDAGSAAGRWRQALRSRDDVDILCLKRTDKSYRTVSQS
ncbi:MAG: FkbM family methyltransferase [Thermoanaerobaculales bacterium]|jgi:FkbM family methyltransferase|nr:FkbM family methyltransferase [Thermoanaerobaculales bacterium]